MAAYSSCALVMWRISGRKDSATLSAGGCSRALSRMPATESQRQSFSDGHGRASTAGCTSVSMTTAPPISFVLILLSTLLVMMATTGCTVPEQSRHLGLTWDDSGVMEHLMTLDSCSDYFSQGGAMPCTGLVDSRVRDACYWNLTLTMAHNSDRNCGNEVCALLVDPYLKFVCARLGLRPHMLEFITSTRLSEGQDAHPRLEACSDLDDYSHLFCIYSSVAAETNRDMEEAKGICEQFQNDLLVGECTFFIATAEVMDIPRNASAVISTLMQLCGELSHPSWRSECFYVLADELSLLSPTDHLDDIADACQHSVDAVEYFNCFDHVALYLPEGLVLDFCSLLDDRYATNCVFGYGRSLGEDWNISFTTASYRCRKFGENLWETCMSGWSNAVALRHSLFNIEKGIEACEDLPEEERFRERCFEGLATVVVEQFKWNASLAVATCELFPDEHEDICFGTVTNAEFWRLRFGGFSSEEDCRPFPEKYREDCLQSLVR